MYNFSLVHAASHLLSDSHTLTSIDCRSPVSIYRQILHCYATFLVTQKKISRRRLLNLMWNKLRVSSHNYSILAYSAYRWTEIVVLLVSIVITESQLTQTKARFVTRE